MGVTGEGSGGKGREKEAGRNEKKVGSGGKWGGKWG